MARDRSNEAPSIGDARDPLAFLPDRRFVLLLGGMIAIVSVTAYLYRSVLIAPLIIYDDEFYVSNNPFVRHGLSWDTVVWSFTTGYFGNWHPLTWISLLWDTSRGGGDASAYHWTNYVLHLLSTGLLMMVFHRWSGSVAVASLGALLFAVHPLHVESVVWVSERKGMLSTFFILLTILAFERYRDSYRWVWFGGTLLLYVCSLLSKQMGVTLPVLLLLTTTLPSRSQSPSDAFAYGRRREWTLYAVMLLLGFTFTVVAYLTQNAAGAVKSETDYTILFRLGGVFVSYTEYLLHYIYPIRLSFHYHRHLMPMTAILASAMFLASVTTAAIVWRNRLRTFTFAWAWYLIAFLPVIGLIQIGDHRMANRYSDIPLMGIHFVVAVFICRCWCRSRTSLQRGGMIATFFAFLGFLTMCSLREIKYWTHEEQLYTRALELDQENPRAHELLGRYHMEGGDIEKAEFHLKQSILYKTSTGVSASNLGKLYMESGRLDEAETVLNEAVQQSPNLFEARLNLATVWAKQGRYTDAEASFRSLLKEDANDPVANRNLASSLRSQGRFTEAIEQYKTTLRLDPSSVPTIHFLAVSLESAGRWPEALSTYEQAVNASRGQFLESFQNYARLRLLTSETDNMLAILERLHNLDRSLDYRAELSMFFANTSPVDLWPLEIRQWIDDATPESSSDTFTRESLGDALMAMGKSAEATNWYSQAERDQPSEWVEQLRLSRQGRMRARADLNPTTGR